jgi:hypothetical protein
LLTVRVRMYVSPKLLACSLHDPYLKGYFAGNYVARQHLETVGLLSPDAFVAGTESELRQAAKVASRMILYVLSWQCFF